MLRHAIAPPRRFTKASHDVVRHPELSSDAKILLLYVQGLPESDLARPLSEHAAKLGMKTRAYQRAKELLETCGYLHVWRWQGAGGLWSTDQLLSNVTLTREEASRLRNGVPPEEPPNEQPPAVGERDERIVGTPPKEEEREKNLPHPPPEGQRPEVAQAERVLLSLRHDHRDLLLGVREARSLAEPAAEWLRCGVSASDLRRALTAGLPAGGVRSAVGFLRHRLLHKLPAAPEPAVAAPRGLVICEGPGDDHVFRPVGDETHCGPCRLGAASRPRPKARGVSWRTLLQEGGTGA
ncbi:hypothetical protein [Streptomyces sp. NBC_01481]|uniref:hypothetical protein n=1 Tax=Streptomyces sp. NBC_01481 TaxID=2975869 RepID=UPI002257CF40|nr:hypothetical protein [Streptomyces sp. NBC_01481]MCX4584550.1 hypothetical protein [Streptomyces sp. NBC_01481]